MIRRPPRSPLFPYTTLSRSRQKSITAAATAAGSSRCGTWPESANTRRLATGISFARSEEHTSELQSRSDLVCRLLLEKKKKIQASIYLHLTRIIMQHDIYRI